MDAALDLQEAFVDAEITGGPLAGFRPAQR